jgi:restriction system-associated AAA family ATPase
MKLLSLEIGEQFRSLHSGFQVHFHKLTDKGVESMQEFQPFCFAGLNGSGKSNVLEALAAIFYHLEMCVAKYRPDSFEKHFSRSKATPDAFTLKYLTCSSNKKDYVLFLADIVTITKEKGKEPVMMVEPNPFSKEKGAEPREVSLKPSARSQERAPGKEFLPDLVVGYSSGENEILSLPFIKNRLIHFDEYKEAVKKGFPFDEPETSLLYIDEEMSQAVLLACMLYEDPETTLKPLRDELGIVGIRSFRMNLNMQTLHLDDEKKDSSPILYQVEHILDKLKKCASSWYEQKGGIKGMRDGLFTVLTLDFFVDEKTKQVFRDHFNSSFELFRFFQVLYELNANIISTPTKEEVYKSRGFYTDGKLPEAGPEDRVFYFLDYMILKEIDGLEKPKELLLREFSDGEHQFLHTMGICLMLKDRRTLLLLDEPETHFNPGWRAKFIKVLNDSLKAGGTNNFLKDVILTSHSPFVISDCLPNNVIFFKRNKDTHKIEAKTARELDFNTYGTSVEIILDELFEYNQSIGDWANEELKTIDFDNIKSKGQKEAIKQELRILGESIEKDLVLAKLNRMKFD